MLSKKATFFQFKIFLWFLSAFCVLMILVPPTDEPDWEARQKRFVELSQDEDANLFERLISTAALKFSDMKSCGADYSYSSWSTSLKPDCIAINLVYLPFRIQFVALAGALLFLIIFIQKPLSAWLNSINTQKGREIEKRFTALSLALLCPATLYFLSFVSLKTLFVSSSLLLILTIDTPLLFLLLCIFLFLFDPFNFGFVPVFVFSFLFFSYLSSSKYFWVRLLVVCMFLSTAFFYNYELILTMDLIINRPHQLTEKLNAILGSFDYYNFEDRYPKIIRPLLTGGSLIFMTANGIKPLVLYAWVIGLLIFWSYKKQMASSESQLDLRSGRPLSMVGFHPIDGLAIVQASLFTILFAVFLLPNYAYGKYYAFLLPFWIYVLLDRFGLSAVLFLLVSSHLVLLLTFVSYFF